MPISALHAAVVDVAGEKPGLVIGADTLSYLVLDSLQRSSRYALSAIPIVPTGNSAASFRFSRISVDPHAFSAALVVADAGLLVRISPGFDISVDLFDPGAGAIYSTITIPVPVIDLPVTASQNLLHISPSSASVAGRTVPAPTRAAAMAASGISEEELLRVEGSLAYGNASRIMNSAIGVLAPIDLAELFPAFRFGGDLDLHKVGEALLIIPEKFEFIGLTGCPKGTATQGLAVTPQNPQPTETGANWPILSATPQPQPHQLSVEKDGLVAAYLPKPILDVQFGKLSPAVTYRDEGHGFIGYSVELSAAIKGVSVAIDIVERAVRLNLRFESWGFVNAFIDVPCVGTVELAHAHILLPHGGRQASVQALIRLGVDTGGRLLMLSEIAGIDLGEAQVDLEVISKYASYGGGYAAIAGFILDAVIGKIIANNLPGMVFDQIKSAVDQHFFVLADMSKLLSLIPGRPDAPSWSADGESALMGLTFRLH